MKLLSKLSALILMITTGCAPEQSKKMTLFNEIKINYIQTIAKNEQMYASGAGGSIIGGPNKDLIKEFSFSLKSQKLVNINQARALTIRCVEQLLSMVNQNEEIRPFLEFFPFRPSGVDLTLTFPPFDKSDPYSDKVYISTIFFMNSKIYYLQYDHEKKDDDFIFEETYEEALERNANNPEKDL